MTNIELLHGDCLDKLKELDENSIDSVVTDPPYELGFMGKKWDSTGIAYNPDLWKEVYRVLKPGGHLLSFGGSRTYHRMAVAIEDAGFDIRDQLMWIYGSGFPKSMNIGMKVDEKLGNERELVERPKSEQRPNADNNRDKNKDVGGFAMSDNKYKSVGNSEWEGWGTALKPAHEPIVMARKPLSEKTVVNNVLEWGTGGINIDDSRIPTTDNLGRLNKSTSLFNANNTTPYVDNSNGTGRFPANLIFDEEAGKLLDEQSGTDRGQKGVVSGNEPSHSKKNAIYGDYSMVAGKRAEPKDSSGGASRFFYCPKTSKRDRNEGLDEFEEKQTWASQDKRESNSFDIFESDGREKTMNKNAHPTVKPTDLMLYLIRLVTPKGGTTLDPFMGSGSTGKAAVRGGFNFIGIEREKEYVEVAQVRIQYEIDHPYDPVTKKRTQPDSNTSLDQFFD